jgi:hypothetical protein
MTVSSTLPTAHLDLEPLASAVLRTSFPHLVAAMDGELMAERLQRSLLDGTGLRVVGSGKPKAELGETSCTLQYPLQVCTRSKRAREVLVLGTMFAEADAAATFEQGTLVPLAARWHDMESPAPRPTGTIADLGVAVSVFPVNSRLPTMVDATDPPRVTELLRPLLGDEKDTAVVGVELVRLRMSRGCVLRYRLPSTDYPIVYGKVGYGTPAATVRNGLDKLAGGELANALRFPRVLSQFPDLDLTVVAEVPGVEADVRVDADQKRVVTAAARIAAALHASGVIAGGPRTFDDELARARNAVGLVRAYAPHLAGWLDGYAAAAAASAALTVPEPQVFSHGSFAPSQLLFAPSGVGILDFDKICQAEPAFDLGRFMAALRVGIAKAGGGTGDEAGALLSETYKAAGGQQATAARAGLYEVAALIRMAAHSWLQLKLSRMRLVTSILQARGAQLGFACA